MIRLLNTPVVAVLLSVLSLSACESDGSSGSSDGTVVTGTGGSTARMTISGDYLYAISGSHVQLFDISTPESPVPYTRVEVDWDIQTLFPYGDYLLVGAANGVHILDNSDPAAPRYVSDFTHAQALDPVVAQDGYAYVTLKRDPGIANSEISNQMNVLDISDITQPRLLNTIAMQGPSGLSIEGDQLYVCDGIAGLKTFSLADPAQPEFSQAVAGVDCSDVIAQEQQLFAIDDLGLSQYSTASGVPILLSTIDTEPVVYVIGQ